MRKFTNTILEFICPTPPMTVDQMKARVERFESNVDALRDSIRRFDQQVAEFNVEYPRHRITY